MSTNARTPKAVLRRLLRDNPDAPDDWICEQFCHMADVDQNMRWSLYRNWLYWQFPRAIKRIEKQDEQRARWQNASRQS